MAIEAPKGELGFYLISDGTPNPDPLSRTPSFSYQLTVLEDLCLGHTVADVMVILSAASIL